MEETHAIPVERGCGTRVAGGLYMELGLGPAGEPVESFLVDPPNAVDMSALGLSAQGVRYIQRDGVTHVLDYVGARHYPNVADFVEEVRRFGLSRRLPVAQDVTRLTAESRILLVHQRASMIDPSSYYRAFRQQRNQLLGAGAESFLCPCGRHELPNSGPYPGMCVGLWWHDVIGGVERSEPVPTSLGRAVSRRMPSFSYGARERPAKVVTAYRPAVFASFPIGRLVGVRDPENAEALDRAMEYAGSTGIETAVVDR